MSALSVLFDAGCNQCSPVVGDVQRTVRIDENGAEYIEYLSVDYPSIVKANGIASDWSLGSMLKAGINPNMSIRTGLSSRLEGAAFAESADAYAEQLINDSNAPKTE